MVKIYPNGDAFYNENRDFLLTNKYTEVFYRFDAPLLKATDKEEYALRVSDEKHTLVVLVKEPFNMLFFGDLELSEELVDFLVDNQYKIKDYLCPSDLGEALIKAFKKRGLGFGLSVGMDFMEAKEKCAVSSDKVERASLSDLEELYELAVLFVKDCGLKDAVNKDHLKERIDEFRVIREKGRIVAMAKYRESAEGNKNISYVFTRKESRGKGYARLVVGSLLNEIIDSGYLACLNVDQKNPISYHLYSSLGFRKIFSQGIFVKE